MGMPQQIFSPTPNPRGVACLTFEEHSFTGEPNQGRHAKQQRIKFEASNLTAGVFCWYEKPYETAVLPSCAIQSGKRVDHARDASSAEASFVTRLREQLLLS